MIRSFGWSFAKQTVSKKMVISRAYFVFESPGIYYLLAYKLCWGILTFGYYHLAPVRSPRADSKRLILVYERKFQLDSAFYDMAVYF